jgi:hypothetical protein
MGKRTETLRINGNMVIKRKWRRLKFSVVTVPDVSDF